MNWSSPAPNTNLQTAWVMSASCRSFEISAVLRITVGIWNEVTDILSTERLLNIISTFSQTDSGYLACVPTDTSLNIIVSLVTDTLLNILSAFSLTQTGYLVIVPIRSILMESSMGGLQHSVLPTGTIFCHILNIFHRCTASFSGNATDAWYSA